MGELQSDKISSLAVTVATAAATLPVPSAPPNAAELASFAGWQSGPYTPHAGTVSVDADAATTISAASIYGWDAVDALWRRIGALNGGSTVTLTANVGHEQRVIDAAIFQSIRVAGTVAGGNVTVKITPIGSKD